MRSFEGLGWKPIERVIVLYCIPAAISTGTDRRTSCLSGYWYVTRRVEDHSLWYGTSEGRTCSIIVEYCMRARFSHDHIASPA